MIMRNPTLATKLLQAGRAGLALQHHHQARFAACCRGPRGEQYYISKRLVASAPDPARPATSTSDGHGASRRYYVSAAVAAAALAGGVVLSLGAHKRVAQALSWPLCNRGNDKKKIREVEGEDNDKGGPDLGATKDPDATSNTGPDGTAAGRRTFTRKEVAEHNRLETGVWITYRGRVYDITNFIRHHPGGSHTIMMGAGGDVEPFWQTYTVHHASEVQHLLATYLIGELTPEDREARRDDTNENNNENNPYANDPQRNPLLRVHSKQPFNAETPAELLMPTYITPTEIFFVRNHLPVPEVDPADYTLAVCRGSDGDPDALEVLAELTLDDLRHKFKPHTVECVIQCSGNRRNDLKRLREIKGLDWRVGAMGNARFTGVRLLDVLEHLGLDARKLVERDGVQHVQLEGLDCDMAGQSYAASISADYAFDPNKEVLLAYEMNGEPLTRDHGFPVRFVAPGVTGARNVKWLGKIILANEESHGHWQRKDYKSFSPSVDMFTLDFSRSVSIQETPVQSAICEPVEGQLVRVNARAPVLPVRGYAYSGGGKMIVRVDVSIDGGQSWLTAQLADTPATPEGLPDYTRRNQVFSWTRWSLDVPLGEELLARVDAGAPAPHLEVLCRAFDSAYNSQPERPETVWNVRGVVNNSWHRVKLALKIEKRASE